MSIENSLESLIQGDEVIDVDSNNDIDYISLYNSNSDVVVEDNKDTDLVDEDIDSFILDDDEEVTKETVKVSNDDMFDKEYLENAGSTELTKEELLEKYQDLVISAIVGNKPESDKCLNYLVSTTSPIIFSDECYILYSVYLKMYDRIPISKIDKRFLDIHLNANKDIIEKSTGHINISQFGTINDSKTDAYIVGVLKKYDRLLGMKSNGFKDFEYNFQLYSSMYKNVQSKKVYLQAAEIVDNGLEVRRKKLIGFEDASSYSKNKISEIEGLIDSRQGEGMVTMDDVLERLVTSKKATKLKVSDFGAVQKMNEVYGGIFTQTFYQVLGPAKGGKSRFCTRICYRAVTAYKQNVTVWAHEGSPEEWSAMMLVIHYDEMMNKGKGPTAPRVSIDRKDVLTGSIKDKNIASQLAVCARDLKNSEKYGKVNYVDRPFNVETFIDEIDACVKANNSKLVIIDYVQLISSLNSRKSERECIAEAYKKLFAYCKKADVAVLTPAQYTQEALKGLTSESEKANELRTAGGGSAEVVRTPDATFALWASTKDLQNNKMYIKSMPCRDYQAYDDIPLYVDLGVAYFMSNNDE